jgi:NTP pyrophosphatase (non-canonical NTP hydrolase)
MNQNDSNSTIQALRENVAQFVRERDWDQFHAPKNLSMSIAIEAAELMEHFQWMDMDSSRSIDESAKQEIGEELADVLCYAIALANQLNLDITTVVVDKMNKNRGKYPVDQFRGRYKKS